MWISRIRVTGGFLNGLDVSLCKGLNVLVGPRGSGKTTFLELLRHALGAQHADQGIVRERQAFLGAVLGAGEVVVDIEGVDAGRHLVVDAAGAGQRPDLSNSVLVLGQNELEEIASDAPSRLKLLDLRTGAVLTIPEAREAESLTGELYDLRQELDDRTEESNKRQRLLVDRSLLSSQEAALLGAQDRQLAEKRAELQALEERVIASGQELQRIVEVRHEVTELAYMQEKHLAAMQFAVGRSEELTSAPRAAEHLLAAAHLSAGVAQRLNAAQMMLDEAESYTREENNQAREAAVPIRETLERSEAGLGQITAQLRNIDAELQTLDVNDRRRREITSRMAALSKRRSEQLDIVETAGEQLYHTRAALARSITASIAQNVIVAVDHLADSSKFRSFLQESLRGTNTRTATIDAVAFNLLPLQLLELIESRDSTGLATAANIALERAEKLVGHLGAKQTLQKLVHVRLTDCVDFRLRDGRLEKSVDELSTGQKCAVTLPIVLSEPTRTLILDQPEDHLDNAYLVSNVIGGIVSRGSSGAQTIIATHNANIPVLGSAPNVIVLDSDGQTGTVDVQGPYDSIDIVDRITRLMEGGREAFTRRSEFYAAHGGLG